MDEIERRQLRVQQEDLDIEYRREKRRSEELLEDINNEKRQFDRDTDDLYQKHQHYLKDLNSNYESNSRFTKNLQEASYEFESTYRQIRIRTEEYIDDNEKEYQSTQLRIENKLMEG